MPSNIVGPNGRDGHHYKDITKEKYDELFKQFNAGPTDKERKYRYEADEEDLKGTHGKIYMGPGELLGPMNQEDTYVGYDILNPVNEPNDPDPHEPGAKMDHGKTRLGLVLDDFADALEHVGRVGTMGAEKYSAHGFLSVPNAQERYNDAMLRHHFQFAAGEDFDSESGLLHLAHQAWNALAVLELELAKRK